MENIPSPVTSPDAAMGRLEEVHVVFLQGFFRLARVLGEELMLNPACSEAERLVGENGTIEQILLCALVMAYEDGTRMRAIPPSLAEENRPGRPAGGDGLGMLDGRLKDGTHPIYDPVRTDEKSAAHWRAVADMISAEVNAAGAGQS